MTDALSADLSAVREWLPEFASVSDADVNKALTEAKLIHTVEPLATIMVVGHLLWEESERAARRTARGETMDETVGPMKGTYATMAKQGDRKARFSNSSYGRRFLTLESRIPRVAMGMVVA